MEQHTKTSRFQIIILSLLKNMQATSIASAVTLHEIRDGYDLQKSYTTLFRNVRQFTQAGYIQEGLRDYKSKTYYITNKGLKLLMEVQ